jgi:hypothetical protein
MSTAKTSGIAPFEFVYRDDLHLLPVTTRDQEINLHGGFATDPRDGFGQLYFGMPGSGILRIDPDLKHQELIQLPEKLQPMNFHSSKIGTIGGNWRLFLPANNDALVAVIDLQGKLDFTLSCPEFEQYQAGEVAFAPTDTVLVNELLFVADGYGANYISVADVIQQKWKSIFGGKTENPLENGKFSTAHGMAIHHHHADHLVIADRPNARLQEHALSGDFIASHSLPAGAWPCGIDTIHWEGRWLAVIGSLFDPVKDRPAPIYILDADTFQVLTEIRPKEELGIQAAQHIHNVVWHIHAGVLYLVCQSWNPGYYFVLEKK